MHYKTVTKQYFADPGGRAVSSVGYFNCCTKHLRNDILQIPGAALSKARVCRRSNAVIVGSNSAGGRGCLSVVIVVCCQVEVSATS